MAQDKLGSLNSIGIFGINGRLGTAVREAATAKDLNVVLTADRSGIYYGTTYPQVIIDATRQGDCFSLLECARKCEAAVIMASPYAESKSQCLINEYAKTNKILIAENLSFGSYMQMSFAMHIEKWAEAMGLSFEIIDRHPRTKSAEKSETAKKMERILESNNYRTNVHVLRYGQPVSDHDLMVFHGREQLLIRHSVHDISVPAIAAINMAQWLMGKESGFLYRAGDYYKDVAMDRPAWR